MKAFAPRKNQGELHDKKVYKRLRSLTGKTRGINDKKTQFMGKFIAAAGLLPGTGSLIMSSMLFLT